MGGWKSFFYRIEEQKAALPAKENINNKNSYADFSVKSV
jgi:hypothetical protein